MDQDPDGVVLLIGSGQQQYRQYLMEGAARRAPLWLIDATPASWQLPFVAGSSVVPMLDSARTEHDEAGLIAAAEQVARQRPVLGAFTYDEGLVISTARVAAALGLRGATVDGADACRDKHRSRRALTAAGLPQPRFALVHDARQAAEAAAEIGYPVVLKPRGMGASIGVRRAGDPTELAEAFGVAEHGGQLGPRVYAEGVLVEQLMVGPEISVDGAVAAGVYHPVFLARKQLGLAPYFEETGHLVDAADPLRSDPALRDVLARAHRALGLADTFTHTEIRLTRAGPVVIEVNARLGGDLIPYLGKLATGLDPGELAVAVATGAPVDATPRTVGCAGISFQYPPEDCRVLDVGVPGPDAVPGLVRARAMVEPGGTVRLPPRAHIGRYAYAICVAPRPDQCLDRLAAASALISLRHEPLELAPAEPRP